MENRDLFLLEIRGEIVGSLSKDSSAEELFQNKTIRPIMKLQNDLFIDYAIKQKNVFFSLPPEKKMSYIENVIQRDIKFRNSLKGMIIALFTIEEYAEYITNSSNLNKRMMNLLIERLKSHAQLLVTSV